MYSEMRDRPSLEVLEWMDECGRVIQNELLYGSGRAVESLPIGVKEALENMVKEDPTAKVFELEWVGGTTKLGDKFSRTKMPDPKNWRDK